MAIIGPCSAIFLQNKDLGAQIKRIKHLKKIPKNILNLSKITSKSLKKGPKWLILPVFSSYLAVFGCFGALFTGSYEILRGQSGVLLDNSGTLVEYYQGLEMGPRDL